MNTKTDTSPGPLDTLKLVVAVVVLLGGIVAYYYFEDESLLLRAVGVLLGVALGLVIAFQTTQGQAIWRFIQSSRVEMRKVVWPTQQETLQTTMMVFVFVLIMGIFFWGLDFFLLWITRLLTGQGG